MKPGYRYYGFLVNNDLRIKTLVLSISFYVVQVRFYVSSLTVECPCSLFCDLMWGPKVLLMIKRFHLIHWKSCVLVERTVVKSRDFLFFV